MKINDIYLILDVFNTVQIIRIEKVVFRIFYRTLLNIILQLQVLKIIIKWVILRYRIICWLVILKYLFLILIIFFWIFYDFFGIEYVSIVINYYFINALIAISIPKHALFTTSILFHIVLQIKLVWNIRVHRSFATLILNINFLILIPIIIANFITLGYFLYFNLLYFLIVDFRHVQILFVEFI